MDNCIQLTINGLKIRFEGIEANNPDTFDIVDKILNSEYDNKKFLIEKLMKAIDTPEVENLDFTLSNKTNPASYIGNNLVGNMTMSGLSKILTRINSPGSDIIIPLVGILLKSGIKVSNSAILITNNLKSGIYSGNHHNKIILNKNDNAFLSNLYKGLSYIYIDNSIKKGHPIKSIIDNTLNKIIDLELTSGNPNTEVEMLQNSYDIYRLKSFFTHSVDNTSELAQKHPELIRRMLLDISSQIEGEIVKFIKEGKEYRAYENSEEFKKHQEIIENPDNYNEIDVNAAERKMLVYSNNYLKDYKKMWDSYNLFKKSRNLMMFEESLSSIENFKETNPLFITMNVNEGEGKITTYQVSTNKVNNFIKELSLAKYSQAKPTLRNISKEIIPKLQEVLENAVYYPHLFYNLNLKLLDYIYNNPDIAAYIFNVEEGYSGRFDAIYRTQKIISDNAELRAIDESKLSGLFDLLNLNVFTDEMSFSSEDRLKISDKSSTMSNKRFRNTTLRVKLTSKKTDHAFDLSKQGILTININAHINQLPVLLWKHLIENRKTKIFVEPITNLDSNESAIAIDNFINLINKNNTIENLIKNINQDGDLYKINEILIQNGSKIGDSIIKRMIESGMAVTAFVPEGISNLSYANRFASLQPRLINKTIKYNGSTIYNQKNTGIRSAHFFKDLSRKSITGLYITDEINSLGLTKRLSTLNIGNTFILDGSEGNIVATIKNKILLNPNFFKSKTQIIENGVYAIGTAFKYGNEIWYLLKNNTENHPLVMVRNTKNGLEEKHLKFIPESFKFHEFLKPFSYNEDLYIAINNGQIINTNTHLYVSQETLREVQKEMYKPIIEEMSRITGLKQGFIQATMNENSFVLDLDFTIEDIKLSNLSKLLSTQVYQDIISDIADNSEGINILSESLINSLFGKLHVNFNYFYNNGELYISEGSLSREVSLNKLGHILLLSIRNNNYEKYKQMNDYVLNNVEDFKSISKPYIGILSSTDLSNQILSNLFEYYFTRRVLNTEYGELANMFDNLELSEIILKMYALKYPLDKMTNVELLRNSVSDLINNYGSEYENGFSELASDNTKASIDRQLETLRGDLIENGELQERCEI